MKSWDINSPKGKSGYWLVLKTKMGLALSEKEEKQESPDKSPPKLVKDKAEGVAPEISKGKNVNRHCLAQQLK